MRNVLFLSTKLYMTHPHKTSCIKIYNILEGKKYCLHKSQISNSFRKIVCAKAMQKSWIIDMEFHDSRFLHKLVYKPLTPVVLAWSSPKAQELQVIVTASTTTVHQSCVGQCLESSQITHLIMSQLELTHL